MVQMIKIFEGIMVDKDLLWFKDSLKNKGLVEKLKNIKLIISDIDGSLTDALIYQLANGEEVKSYNVQDGFAMSKAAKNNLIKIALLSGKNGRSIELRAEKLGIPKELVFLGVDADKSKVVREIQNKLGISKDETLMFGDDVLDLETKDEIGMLVCPQNSLFYVSANADLLIPKLGGSGAFRMLLDLVLYVQGKHFAQNFIEKLVS